MIQSFEKKFTRLDGKKMTEKQKKELLAAEKAKDIREDQFDPRKHRIPHGIRGYQKKVQGQNFSDIKGKGVSLR